ncbi:type I DNA topoisomerase, partial [Patescibacteria group bacterium]|nr:type I DNA topoisomerase [Patescibacteria group bacterium]
MKLIIVESPTKAKTITRFLSDDFLVESCDGHIRDLPRGKMGIDLEHDFEPHYVIPRKKQKTVTRIKKAAQKADKIYLATDEDREGEAISWHLAQIIKSVTDQPLIRISFHEITKEAIKESLKNPREINQNLFKAQQSRRILDRLVGYELSPLLWKKLFKGLSAGRVQSPALRLIVERENEIKKFKPEEYWSIEAELKKDQTQFTAKLVKEDNKTIAKMGLSSESPVQIIVKDLEKAVYQVIEVKNKQLTKSPLPPFTTSTLQQEANKKLKFSVKQTMFLAQKLYEGIALEKKGAVGLITYPRTDALTLADKFLNEAEKFISQEYGEKYADRRHYKAKSKLAQEAHEAIRPTDCFKTPEKVKSYLEPKVYKLYELIWNRAVASQMSTALINSVKADIKAEKYLLRANGSSIEFEGWLKLYPGRLTENYLPPLTAEEIVKLIKINPQQHFTEPPPRFTEARLVKTLEEYGIGRPSTYSPIISTIQARNYVEKE